MPPCRHLILTPHQKRDDKASQKPDFIGLMNKFPVLGLRVAVFCQPSSGWDGRVHRVKRPEREKEPLDIRQNVTAPKFCLTRGNLEPSLDSKSVPKTRSSGPRSLSSQVYVSRDPLLRWQTHHPRSTRLVFFLRVLCT